MKSKYVISVVGNFSNKIGNLITTKGLKFKTKRELASKLEVKTKFRNTFFRIIFQYQLCAVLPRKSSKRMVQRVKSQITKEKDEEEDEEEDDEEEQDDEEEEEEEEQKRCEW